MADIPLCVFFQVVDVGERRVREVHNYYSLLGVDPSDRPGREELIVNYMREGAMEALAYNTYVHRSHCP